jgi:tRNA G18 (ribose-2'-O)-methylase SpoU
MIEFVPSSRVSNSELEILDSATSALSNLNSEFEVPGSDSTKNHRSQLLHHSDQRLILSIMDHEAETEASSQNVTLPLTDKYRASDQVSIDEAMEQCRPPDMHMVVTNISKPKNIRALLQTAAAFGCKSVLVVGQKTFDMDPAGSDIPAALQEHIRSGGLSIQRFASWDDCVSYLKERKIRLVGVEIHEDAQPIEHFFDSIDTAFLMGNEGQGLNDKQMKSCDAFVRIPQYGSGTASLNVYVASSIILHRYHHWQRGESVR